MLTLLCFCQKNFKGEKTIDHCFLNNRLLFLLFFPLFFENFRGQMPFRRAKLVLRSAPCSRKPAPCLHDLSKHDLQQVPEGAYRNLNSAFSEWIYYREHNSQNISKKSISRWAKITYSLCQPKQGFHKNIYWNWNPDSDRLMTFKGSCKKILETKIQWKFTNPQSKLMFAFEYTYIIAWLKFIYGQIVRFPTSFPCSSLPVPFCTLLVQRPY